MRNPPACRHGNEQMLAHRASRLGYHWASAKMSREKRIIDRSFRAGADKRTLTLAPGEERASQDAVTMPFTNTLSDVRNTATRQ